MSKSYNNTLPIFGEEKATRKLIMRIPTDSTPVEEPKPTENSIILQLYKLFASAEGYEDMVRDFRNGGCGYGDFKKDLVEVTVESLAPIKERYEAIRNSDELLTILNDGAEKADAIAQKTMQRVRAYFGLGTGY